MKNKRLLYYTLTSFVSVTAYEVYQATLANYNFGFALAGFQGIALIVLRFLYPYIERTTLNTIESDQPERGNTTLSVLAQSSLSLSDAISRQPVAIPLLGIVNCLYFGLMLPFLQTMDNSLLFIVFFSLSGLLKVPVAMWVFDDKVGNGKLYTLGILLASLGGIAYTINPLRSVTIFTGNWQLLLAVLIRVPLEILDSMLNRYITTPKSSREATVSVQATESIKAIFTIVFGLLIGLITTKAHLSSSIIPTNSQWFGLLWIGIVVTLTTTISKRLLNTVGHTAAQPILSTRPLLAFIPFALLYISDGGNPADLSYKFMCLLVVLAGTTICLQHGLVDKPN